MGAAVELIVRVVTTKNTIETMQSNYFVSDIQSMINSSHMASVQTMNGPHQLHGASTQNGGVGNAMHNNGPSMVSQQTHAPAADALRCTVCGESFRKMANLKRHMKSHGSHGSHEVKAEATVMAVGTVTSADSDSPYKCNACKIEYPNATIFEHHIRTEHGQPTALKCTECGCFRPILLSSVSPFRCESCSERRGRGFDESGFLKYRVVTTAAPMSNANVQPLYVSSAKPTKIDVSSMITTPRMVEASGRRPRKLHQCMECGKNYKHQSTLAMHKKIHTGEYKYKCEYCDKEFYLTEYYNRHMRVHTKESEHRFHPSFACLKYAIQTRPCIFSEPYQCDVCDRAFSQSNTLTQHKRIHTGLYSIQRESVRKKINKIHFVFSRRKAVRMQNLREKFHRQGLSNETHQVGEHKSESCFHIY